MQGRLLTERQAAQRAQIQGELDGLMQQRGELQSQLAALSERRHQLFAQSVTATPASKAEIDSRLSEIDARSARLDRQIESLNDRISETMARVNGTDPGVVRVPRIVQGPEIRVPNIVVPPGRRGPDMGVIAGIMAGEAITLALLGVLFWRIGVKRLHAQFESMVSSQSQQLNQLQQAVDTVAVEVERISEAQRYVAKVITEGASPALASPRDGQRRT